MNKSNRTQDFTLEDILRLIVRYPVESNV